MNNNKFKLKFSLKKKALLAFVILTVVIIAVASWLFARTVFNNTQDRYSEKLEQLTASVAAAIDTEQIKSVKARVAAVYGSSGDSLINAEYGTPEFDEYMARYDGITEDPDFIALRDYLREISDINKADCVYLAYIDPVYERFIYMVDSAEEDPCLPGTLDPILEQNRELLVNPERGFPAYESSLEEYGHLLSAGSPIHIDGRVEGYVMADMPYEQIISERAGQVLKFAGYVLAAFVVLGAIAIFIINRFFVRPIISLSDAAQNYSLPVEGKSSDSFSSLKIRTGDEIELLANSMREMERDLNESVTSLFQTREELITSQNLADRMSYLASKDALTGVRNKISYDDNVARLENDLKQGIARFGIAMIDLNGLKKHNDLYGHECGDAAIVRLCDIVCDVFDHSPVFRIGGDEFAVILTNRDYDNIESLVETFNKKLEEEMSDPSVEKKDKIAAAIGYALYDAETDSSVSDVFNRADAAMYERKRAMKGE